MNRAALVCSLGCALSAAPAFAQAPPRRIFGTDDAPPPGVAPPRERIVMRLAYTGAGGCSDAQLLRDAVGAQVRRWEPFAPNAPWQLAVVVVQRGAGYEASAELRDVTGAISWTRRFAPTAACLERQDFSAARAALARVKSPRFAAERDELRRLLAAYQDGGR